MKLSAFSVNMIFVVLMLLGLSLTPRISLQVMPSSRSNELSVSFSWANANPEMLEMEVTSKLEGAFALTKGLASIRSQTGQGYGMIVLSIDKTENIDAVKLYLSSIIRSLQKSLPEGVRVGAVEGGEIRNGEQEEGAQLLLNYTITGPGSTQEVASFAEEEISPVISQIPGIENVSITGAVPFEWVLYYQPQTLQDIHLSSYDIANAINKYYSRRDGGKVLLEAEPEEKYSYIVFKGNPLATEANFLDIPVKTINGKTIYLKNITTLDYREASPVSYYRINGLNRININIFCQKKSNMIDLSAKVKNRMEELEASFPQTYSMKMILDNSEELKDELGDNLLRTGVTILILLVFVWLTSRSWRYLSIITICLTANILIALAFYYLFGIEIHLYALAGITVSFGIIIDNVIVMADHYRHHQNRKVFMAILAATLTTMGALVVIFNMDNEVMRNMWGFSSVIIINLTLSILIALFFVPALMEKIPLPSPDPQHHHRRLRRVVRFTGHYEKVVRFMQRHRLMLFIIILLGFGLPVFLIPTTLDRDKPMAQIYNQIFSSELYLRIKPWLDKSLGGSLRLFIVGGGGDWREHNPTEKARTTLNLTMTMPHGASLEQMNEAFLKVEQFLAGFSEIATFTSDIRSANIGRMQITFKKENELTGAPEMIKNELIRFANSIGNADSDVSGVGRGFSNHTANEYRSESLKVTGYNYRKVLLYANQLKDKLEQQKRVKKLYIGNVNNPNKAKEFAIEADKARLARNNSDVSSMLAHLSNLSGKRDYRTEAYINQKLSPIVIRSTQRQEASLWELQNRPLQGNKSVFRLEDVGKIAEDHAFESITKRDQEYEVAVQYDFLGDYMLSKKGKERVIKEMNREMPVGFQVKEADRWSSYYWEGAGGIDTRIWYILLVITIIYFICAILLESLRQALVVILIAPISFIGCFLGFYFFGLKFNEGGLAAFIMMCGLSVNAILYIINDYNNRLAKGRPRGLTTYLHAYNAKIIPILLTIVSTLLGFTPFLIGEVSDFWTSLAIGTMSGLGFSLIVLILILPTMFREGKKSVKTSEKDHDEGKRMRSKWKYIKSKVKSLNSKSHGNNYQFRRIKNMAGSSAYRH